MHLSKVNQALNHKIVGGSEYCWKQWPNARFLDYESEYAYASVVFNTETQEVYSAEVNDKKDIVKPYRWLNPIYKDVYYEEASVMGADPDQAWDDVKWYDLEVEEDWLEKASAIMSGETFDHRVKVPLDLNKDELFALMQIAHEKDITLNSLVQIMIQEAVDRAKDLND